MRNIITLKPSLICALLGISLYSSGQTINKQSSGSAFCAGSTEIFYLIPGTCGATITSGSQWHTSPATGVTIVQDGPVGNPWHRVQITFPSNASGTYSIWADWTGSGCSSYSSSGNPLQVTLSQPASSTITISPSSNNVCQGTSVTFTATASNPMNMAGESSPSYQWYLNNSAVSGATSSEWTKNDFADGDEVKASVSYPFCSVLTTSDEVEMEIKPTQHVSFSITSSKPDGVCSNENVRFYITDAQDFGSSYTVTWYIGNSGDPASLADNPPGFGQTNLFVNNWSYANNTEVKAKVAVNGCPDVTPKWSSNTVTVPLLTPQPFSADLAVRPGKQIFEYCPDEIYFEASSSHSATYAWFKNNNAITTGSIYDNTGVVQGDVIKLVATATVGCVTQSPKEVSLTLADPYKIMGTATATNISCSGDVANNYVCNSSNQRCQGGGYTDFTSNAYNGFTNGVTWSITQTDNSGGHLNSFNASTARLTWNAQFHGSVTVTVSVDGCNDVSISKTITVNPTLGAPSISIVGPNETAAAFICPGSNEGTFYSSISGPGTDSPTATYEWYINSSRVYNRNDPQSPNYDANLPANTPPRSMLVIPYWEHGDNVLVTAKLNTGASCQAQNTVTSNAIRVYSSLSGVSLSPASSSKCTGPGETEYTVSEVRAPYTWTLIAGGGGSSIDPNESDPTKATVTWDSNLEATAPAVAVDSYVQVYVTGCQLPETTLTATMTTLTRPATPDILTTAVCNWERANLKPQLGTGGTFNWFNQDGSTLLSTGRSYSVGPVVDPGTIQYKYQAVGSNGCPSVGKATATVEISDDCDLRLNTVETLSYEDETLISNSKSYFDYVGSLLQSQTKDLERSKVMIIQSVPDRYGRAAVSTLPAPGPISGFKYKVDFMRSTENNQFPVFSFEDFDTPETNEVNTPLNTTAAGTLGHYYYFRDENSDQTIPRSKYPYSRSEFHADGTGAVKKEIGVGDIFRNTTIACMCPGGFMILRPSNYVTGATFPIRSELSKYFQIRTEWYGAPAYNPNGLVDNGVVAVSRDAQGQYAIQVSDKSGKSLMAARGVATNEALEITNVIQKPATTTPQYVEIFLVAPYDVQNTSGAGVISSVKNLITDELYSPEPVGNWPAGFYRITYSIPSGQGNLVLTYKNKLADVSMQFYDEQGRLRASLSPNGFQQHTQTQNPVALASTDHTSFVYNYLGWLVSSTEPDAGQSLFKYTKDGKIRFSQNAKQHAASPASFSYTHYDAIGRPVESGEFIGGSINFSDLDSEAELNKPYQSTDDPNTSSWTDGDKKKDWVHTYYDVAPQTTQGFTFPAGHTIQNYVQGNVSWTENEFNATYYSYDEFGRLSWIVQKPKTVSVEDTPVSVERIFVTDYTYDLSGLVTQVKSYSCDYSGTIVSSTTFYHHYEYDNDKRLSYVKTSLDGQAKQLRAHYLYYLHGPLKRIELGDKLQGIDFVYNVQGWLTQINHPDFDQDPGNDGDANGFRKDVFGMALDYYESSVNGVFAVSGVSRKIDPFDHHNVPQFARNNVERLENGFAEERHSPEQALENIRLMRKFTSGF